MTIHNITFSPTGGTRRVGELLCKELGGECVTTELCTKKENLKLPGIHTDDLTVISMPVYAGRVPSLPYMATGLTKTLWWRCRMWQLAWDSVWWLPLPPSPNTVSAACMAPAVPMQKMPTNWLRLPPTYSARSRGMESMHLSPCRATDHTSRAARVPTPQQTTTARAVERVRANVLPEPFLPTIREATTTDSASAACDA